MISRVVLPLCGCLILLAGCMDSPVAPQCTATPFQQASVEGDTITTTTGLRYIEGDPGLGSQLQWCRAVAVHYTGFLADGDGTPFDTFRDPDVAFVFTPGLEQLIDGFEQGVIGMRRGGERRIIVPPSLAYGSREVRNASGELVIPANATLIYDITIIDLQD